MASGQHIPVASIYHWPAYTTGQHIPVATGQHIVVATGQQIAVATGQLAREVQGPLTHRDPTGLGKHLHLAIEGNWQERRENKHNISKRADVT